MDVLDAIKARKSIRAFKPDPVPRKVLTELMQTCLNAPSWANSQPWEFAVVGGAVLDEVKRRIVERMAAGARPNPDLPWPTAWPDLYIGRIRENGRQLFEVLGIARDDREKRAWWSQQGGKFFDAPNGIIVYMERALPVFSVLDCGIILQTIMLGALEHGLGTCPEVAVVTHPDILREVLGLPDSKIMILGLAIGYPDMDALPNKYGSHREPLEDFVHWHGVD